MSRRHHHYARTISVILSAMTPFALFGTSVRGATSTWKPNTPSPGNWTAPESWSENIAPVAGNDLFFGTADSISAINDFPAGTVFNSIAFGNSGRAYTLSGNAIVLTGNIVYNNTSSVSSNSPTILALPIALAQNVSFDAGRGTLTFTNTISGLSGTPTLTLTGTGTGNSFISGAITDGSATHLNLAVGGATTWTLSGPLSYTGSTTLNGGALKLPYSTNSTFSSSLSGPGSLVLSPATAATTLTLTGNNTGYSGNVDLPPGGYVVANDSAFGTGTLTLHGGGSSNFPTLSFTNGPRVVANALLLASPGVQHTIVGASDVTFTGPLSCFGTGVFLRNNLDPGATLYLNGDLNLSNTGSPRTFSIRGSGTTVINGDINNGIVSAVQDCIFSPTGLPSSVTILNSSQLTYTGGTIVVGGTTVFNVPGVLPPARNLQNTADAKITLGTASAVAYVGGIMNPAFLSRVSGITGALAILNAADAATDVDFSAATPTPSSPSWASLGLGAAMGSFTYSGQLTPRGQEWRLGGGNGTLTFTQAMTDRNSAPANLTILGGVGALILASTGNAYTGTTTILSEGHLRNGVINALPSESSVLIAMVRSTYDLAGFDQALAGLSGSGSITSSAGAPTFTTNLAANSTFSGAISGTMSLFKTGAATLTLGGPLSYAGTTAVQSGALVVNGSSNILHTITGGGLLQLAQNCQLTADVLSLNSLQLDAGAVFSIRPNQAAASQLGVLTLAADTNGTFTARLELADSPLILQTGTGNKATTLAMLQSAVAAGGAGVVGITSSTTLADVTHKTTVVVDNALLHLTTFGGVAVDDTALLVEATWFGDSNLDRKVNVTDLGVLATNYGGPTALGPVGGDFNNDGVVNVTDLGLLATNYGAGTAGAPFSIAADLGGHPALAAAVPEPASLGVLSLAAVLALRRGARRR